MRYYGVDDYGLIMTDEMLKTIASKHCADYTEEAYNENDWDFKNELYEAGIIEYISEFTGESVDVEDDGRDVYTIGEEYWNEAIFYVPVNNYRTLFKAAYNNMDEIVSEFRWHLHELLPEDFDYRGHVRHIVGSYYG
jgi:hypothetical protein